LVFTNGIKHEWALPINDRRVYKVSEWRAIKIQGNPDKITNRAWWALTGSNRRHSACKADALPTELSAP
jgi:hypothetical protein